MAAVLVAFLENQGWDVYQEVRIWPDNPTSEIADIIAVKFVPEYDREILWLIETKTSLNFALCEQALSRRQHAHLVSVAVPKKHTAPRHYDPETDSLRSIYVREKKPAKGFRFAKLALQKFNIGLILVADPAVKPEQHPVAQPLEPVFHEDEHTERWVKRVRDWLKPEHKTMAKAGTKGQRVVTPFRLTCRRLTQVVRDTDGWISLRDALVLADHHYASLSGGVSSMAIHIERGIVDDGFEIKREGRKIFVRHGENGSSSSTDGS